MLLFFIFSWILHTISIYFLLQYFSSNNILIFQGYLPYDYTNFITF